MSSLQELTVADQTKLRPGLSGICTSTVCGKQELEIEPDLIALGQAHVRRFAFSNRHTYSSNDSANRLLS